VLADFRQHKNAIMRYPRTHLLQKSTLTFFRRRFRRKGVPSSHDIASGGRLAHPIEDWRTMGHLASLAGHADSGRTMCVICPTVRP